MNPEHLQIIQKVAEHIAPKYTFGYMDVDDLVQEAIIFGLDVYDKWDEDRPLENFISVHISNRLKNFKRDNYFRLGLDDSPEKRKKANETKKRLMQPGPLKTEPLFFEDIDNEEEMDYLMMKLPPLVKNDFLRMSNGVPVTKFRKQQVIDHVKEILGEDW